MNGDATRALLAFEHRAQGFLEILCSVLLVAMVLVTGYTVVMRYASGYPRASEAAVTQKLISSVLRSARA